MDETGKEAKDIENNKSVEDSKSAEKTAKGTNEVATAEAKSSKKVLLSIFFGVAFVLLILTLLSQFKSCSDSLQGKSKVIVSPDPDYNLNTGQEKRENRIKEVNDSIVANLKLALNPKTKDLDVDVDSKGGTITLNGTVSTEEKKLETESVIKESVGVQVENRIKVAEVTDEPERGIRVGSWFTRIILISLFSVFVFIGLIIWLSPDGHEVTKSLVPDEPENKGNQPADSEGNKIPQSLNWHENKSDTLSEGSKDK